MSTPLRSALGLQTRASAPATDANGAQVWSDGTTVYARLPAGSDLPLGGSSSVPAHTALSSLAWPGGHTGAGTHPGLAGFVAAGTGTEYQATSDGLTVARRRAAVAFDSPDAFTFPGRIAWWNSNTATVTSDAGASAATQAAAAQTFSQLSSRWMRFLATNTTLNNVARLTFGNFGVSQDVPHVWRHLVATGPTSVASAVYWLGAFASSPPSTAATALTGAHVGVYADSAGGWVASAADGATQATAALTGSTLAADTIYEVEIDCSGASLVVRVSVLGSGTWWTATVASNLPGATVLTGAIQVGISAGGTARSVGHSRTAVWTR